MSAPIKTWTERTISTKTGAMLMAMEQEIADLRAALAQKEAAAPGDLHAAIMRLTWTFDDHVNKMPSNGLCWRLGFVAARHAAAELARAALAQPVAVDAPRRPVHDENARFAIDGAILFGRNGVNKPPTEDHWLMEYWNMGARLAAIDAQDGERDNG